ncbi:FeoB-associated Cys-rich membrane protein [Thermodesulfobacteriota bacterium B35]
MQHLIVLLIILVAAFFIGRRFWRFLRPGRRPSCSCGCCGCSAASGTQEASCSRPAPDHPPSGPPENQS